MFDYLSVGKTLFDTMKGIANWLSQPNSYMTNFLDSFIEALDFASDFESIMWPSQIFEDLSILISQLRDALTTSNMQMIIGGGLLVVVVLKGVRFVVQVMPLI